MASSKWSPRPNPNPSGHLIGAEVQRALRVELVRVLEHVQLAARLVNVAAVCYSSRTVPGISSSPDPAWPVPGSVEPPRAARRALRRRRSRPRALPRGASDHAGLAGHAGHRAGCPSGPDSTSAHLVSTARVSVAIPYSRVVRVAVVGVRCSQGEGRRRRTRARRPAIGRSRRACACT